MSRIHDVLADRRRRQRGSVLSGVLIIVAMLAILIGALMTQLSSAFQLSRIAATRVATEATVNSAVELGIENLQNSSVPPVCVRDGRGPWYLTLNGKPAAVTQTCNAIVPDLATSLVSGSFTVDGMHETLSGINDFVVGDQSGRLRAYAFGTSNLRWSINAGGAITAAGFAWPDEDNPGHASLLVPNAGTRPTCGGHCVTLYDQSAGTPSYQCDMPAGGTVTATPAAELSPSGYQPNFPGYAFFGDSSGLISVYDADTTLNCPVLAQQTDLSGGAIVGQPLVFTGIVTTKQGSTTSVADIFVVTSNAVNTWLEHWKYTETDGSSGFLAAISNLPLVVGGTAVVSRPNLPVLNLNTKISQVVAGRSGALEIVTINASKNSPTYTMASGPTGTAPSNVTRAPFWCVCPGGDLIGVGSTSGALKLLNSSLSVQWTYPGQAPINTTPVADSNGDWYFGADDGYVHDVEMPASGSQLFQAAKFGPGGQIQSSPVEAGCSTGPCMYFGSSTSGAYFVLLGKTRVSDLRACISATPDCAGAPNPRLWARVTVGPPSVVGGMGISVQGWSYYSPP